MPRSQPRILFGCFLGLSRFFFCQGPGSCGILTSILFLESPQAWVGGGGGVFKDRLPPLTRRCLFKKKWNIFTLMFSGFYLIYNFWQDAGIRTQVAASYTHSQLQIMLSVCLVWKLAGNASFLQHSSVFGRTWPTVWTLTSSTALFSTTSKQDYYVELGTREMLA